MLRVLTPLVLLALAALLVPPPPAADARPPFARREGKACGYCHINPRGGGPRNQRGLEYARNEFSFPPSGLNLNAFEKERNRAAMVGARKLVDLDHNKAAIAELRKLSRAVKEDTPAATLVEAELHALEVKGTEILGQARRLLRSSAPEEGIELLAVLVAEFKGLAVHADAVADLKEAKRNKEWRDAIRREEREAKARLLFLDGVRAKAEGDAAKAARVFAKVVKRYPGTRAAENAAKELPE